MYRSMKTAAALCLAAVLAGCSSAAPASSSQTSSKASISSQETASSTSSKSAASSSQTSGQMISASEAQEKALAQFNLQKSDVREYSSELEQQNNLMVYDIEFDDGTTEYNVAINAETGEVLSALSEEDEQGLASISKQSSDTLISAVEAQEIAFKHSNVTMEDISHLIVAPDYEDGKPVFDIEFRKGASQYSYDIDAETGEIIDYDVDYD